MQTKLYWILIVIEIYLCACNKQNCDYTYYDTGELKTCIRPTDNEIIRSYNAYYKNGTLASTGFIDDHNYCSGLWKEYYEDGVLVWQGHYTKNGVAEIDSLKLISDVNSLTAWIDIDKKIIHPSTINRLKTKHKYNIRTYIDGVHPMYYEILYSTDSLYYPIPINSDKDQRMFPYYIETPSMPCILTIMFVLPEFDKTYIVGKRSIVFNFIVE